VITVNQAGTQAGNRVGRHYSVHVERIRFWT
jgi:hypothetical protein